LRNKPRLELTPPNVNIAILSLGSNKGDRGDFIAQAVSQIQQSVGTVVRVSGFYESDAWGFDGAPFYNAAIAIHTKKSAQDVLAGILQIEQSLGRTREGQGYSERTIDIDLIAFNDEVISADGLKVPHPLMHHRQFVLLPMRDLNIDWNHPQSGKSIPELLAESGDDSKCVRVGKLDSPLDRYPLQRYNYIAIEGNIGAGKTTLTNRIAADFNAKTVLERFADNPFLPKFYEDQPRYAFPLEMSFLADRYQQIADDLAQFDLFKDFIVADYHIFKSLIFAKVTLSEDEYRLYKKLFDIIYREMPKPDLYVYLYQNTERLLQNIRTRGRSYEQEIPAQYLEQINQGYLDYIKSQQNLNVLMIDVSELDFVKNQEDYITILEAIRTRL